MRIPTLSVRSACIAFLFLVLLCSRDAQAQPSDAEKAWHANNYGVPLQTILDMIGSTYELTDSLMPEDLIPNKIRAAKVYDYAPIAIQGIKGELSVFIDSSNRISQLVWTTTSKKKPTLAKQTAQYKQICAFVTKSRKAQADDVDTDGHLESVWLDSTYSNGAITPVIDVRTFEDGAVQFEIGDESDKNDYVDNLEMLSWLTLFQLPATPK